jgi:hypothetical protein
MSSYDGQCIDGYTDGNADLLFSKIQRIHYHSVDHWQKPRQGRANYSDLTHFACNIMLSVNVARKCWPLIFCHGKNEAHGR